MAAGELGAGGGQGTAGPPVELCAPLGSGCTGVGGGEGWNLTWFIRSAGRGPPGYRGDMKGCKRGRGAVRGGGGCGVRGGRGDRQPYLGVRPHHGGGGGVGGRLSVRRRLRARRCLQEKQSWGWGGGGGRGWGLGASPSAPPRCGVPGPPQLHTHTLQPQQFPHSSRPPSPPSPQGTWKKPGGMGPPAMPSLGGRLPITGLGAAAALCGGRRAEQRVGSSPPRQGAALCPPAALGAPPSRPPSTHGAPSPTSQPPHASPPPRPQPRPGLWGQRASDRAARGEPGRCPPVGCSGAGGGLGGSVGLQGGLQGGPAPLACQPRSGGSC